MSYIVIKQKQVDAKTTVVLSVLDGYYQVNSVMSPPTGAYIRTEYCKTQDFNLAKKTYDNVCKTYVDSGIGSVPETPQDNKFEKY